MAKGNLAGGIGDMDAAIEANKCRQSVAEKIRSMLRIKSGKKVEPVIPSTARVTRSPTSMMWRSPQPSGLTAPS